MAIAPVSQVHPLLPFFLPYLYFTVRLGLYKLWYLAGFHPLPKRRYVSGPKGGMHLPVFTRTTEEYQQLRAQQSLKYQIVYNLYKIAYRSVYFALLTISISLIISKLFTEDNRYPGSPLQEALQNVSGGSQQIEKILFVSSFLLAVVVCFALYQLGKSLWHKLFYKRYPVRVLLMERDEPIFTIKNEMTANIMNARQQQPERGQ